MYMWFLIVVKMDILGRDEYKYEGVEGYGIFQKIKVVQYGQRVGFVWYCMMFLGEVIEEIGKLGFMCSVCFVGSLRSYREF